MTDTNALQLYYMEADNLARRAERDGVIIEIKRIPLLGLPLAMGNHKPRVTVWESAAHRKARERQS